MRKLSIFLLIVGLFAIVTPAVGKVVFYDDCEDYPSLTDEGGTDWGLTENSGKLTVSSEKSKAGSKSYKMGFTATPQNTGRRVELVLRAGSLKNWSFGEEYWLGYSIFIPSDFSLPTGYGVIGQWHKAGDYNCDQLPRPENAAVAQPLGFSFVGTSDAPRMQVGVTAASGSCDPAVNGYSYWEKFQSRPFVKGAWNDVVVHVKFEYNKPGITEVWLNGNKFVNVNPTDNPHPNAHNDPKSPSFKLGFYGTSQLSHVVYYDEIRIGDSSSSYNEVAPSKNDSVVDTKMLEAPTLSIVGASR